MEYRTLENIDSICIYEAFTQAVDMQIILTQKTTVYAFVN